MNGPDHNHNQAGGARSVFWDDLSLDMEHPEFRAAYEAAWPAILGNPCHHCGRLGSDPDGDHSCPCPHPDATCPDHRREVSS